MCVSGVLIDVARINQAISLHGMRGIRPLFDWPIFLSRVSTNELLSNYNPIHSESLYPLKIYWNRLQARVYLSGNSSAGLITR